MANEIRERASQLPAEVLRLTDLALLCFYFLPSMISYIVPVTFFLGMLLAFGRLAQQGEIIALRSAGISLKRATLPVIAAGAVLTAFCFFVQDRVQPWAIGRAYALMQDELGDRLTLDALSAGVVHEHADWRIYFNRKKPTERLLFDVDIVRPEEDGGLWVFHAASAQVTEGPLGRSLVLRDGHFVTPDNLRSEFEKQELMIPQRPSADTAGRDRLGSNLRGLLARDAERTREYEQTQSYRLGRQVLKERREITDRVSLPFAVLAVSFVGAPLGVRAARGRRGTRVQLFTAGLGVLLAYYLLRAGLEPNGMPDLSTLIVRAWIPNVVLTVAGVTLLARVDRV